MFIIKEFNLVIKFEYNFLHDNFCIDSLLFLDQILIIQIII